MGLKEGNEFTNNIYVISFSIIGFIAFELATMSFQILSGNTLVNVFIGMLQLVGAVVVNLLFGKIGFTISVITSLLQIGLFSYDYYYYNFRQSSAFMIAFALSAILINIVIQFFLDTVYTRMFRVKSLYNQTRERLFKITEENHNKRKTDLEKQNETKIIVKHDENVAVRNEIASVTMHLDELTTLPDRTRIIRHLDELIDDSTSMMQSGGGINKDKSFSVHVIYVAITNFDRLLHLLGHHKLDLYIQFAAHKLREQASPSDLVGRVEAGEFVVVTKRTLSKEELEDYANKFSSIIISAFKNDSVALQISTSIGISCFPGDARFSGDLLNCAEYAVSRGASIVAGNENICTWFSDVNDARHSLYAENPDKERTSKIEKCFATAFDKKEIFVVYQPQYNSRNELVGFEALLRWNSPELGLVKASEFMSVAEQSGLIYKLGQYTLETSMRFMNKVNALNKKLKLTINFSSMELKYGNTPGALADLMSKYSINPSNIIVDIPEECLVSSFDTAKPTLNYISSLGVSMTLDNFGRGYSSLNNIPLLPISTIKIDGFFTKNIHEDKTIQIITSSIINLMHEIDINVCATGVGSKEQLEKLQEYGCDLFQGQVCGEPMSERDILKMVSEM